MARLRSSQQIHTHGSSVSSSCRRSCCCCCCRRRLWSLWRVKGGHMRFSKVSTRKGALGSVRSIARFGLMRINGRREVRRSHLLSAKRVGDLPGRTGWARPLLLSLVLHLSLACCFFGLCWHWLGVVNLNLHTTRRALAVLLQPGSQAIEVEDVTAGQLLGVRGLHLFSADDASVIHPRELFCRGVGEPRVHVDNHSSIANEISNPLLKVPKRVVEVPDNV
mmetsp:Transcript_25310/g.83666  ORF Transcript_25310/g.83666 Transcript_25310/m.83666 type:complete len:221 (-) Transcript_25310:875-1537(-)